MPDAHGHLIVDGNILKLPKTPLSLVSGPERDSGDAVSYVASDGSVLHTDLSLTPDRVERIAWITRSLKGI
ncbi:MAG TPA: hypothetical protein VGP33_14455 [Chloroflexota bacterium]|jgi:hypothetical protein|nr:hypothetical protein [Chloroflexota bacterium]